MPSNIVEYRKTCNNNSLLDLQKKCNNARPPASHSNTVFKSFITGGDKSSLIDIVTFGKTASLGDFLKLSF